MEKVTLASTELLKEYMEKIDLRAFNSELSKRVYGYFKEKNMSFKGGTWLYVKAALLLLGYIGGYVALAFGLVQGALWWVLWPIMGLFVAGVGMCVMHDASHQAFHKKKWVNKWVGYSMNLLGSFMGNWIEQHAVRHHVFTNVDPRDEDVQEIHGIMRFHPGGEWKPGYRYQHITAWFMYSLMNVQWMTTRDFTQLARYMREKETPRAERREQWARLIAIKVAYFAAWFVVPLFFGAVFWQLLVGWVLMQMVAGFVLALTFQMAHVVTGCTFFQEPLEVSLNGPIRAVHQLLTTTNFKTWLGGYMGGLNHQIEHHLFPNISHIHYPKIAPIVRDVCEKYGVPYRQNPSWVAALVAHYQMLRALGVKA